MAQSQSVEHPPVTDAFRVGSGDAEQDGRVSEAGRDVDKDLASTSKLHPCCT